MWYQISYCSEWEKRGRQKKFVNQQPVTTKNIFC